MEPAEETEKRRYTPENPWTPPKRPDGYDELGEEMAPSARVWKKYVEETDKADKELVEGWNKTLDVILIFAALFSAISTAFVLESSKDLKQDYTQTSAKTLFLMSHTLATIASGSPVNGSTLEAPDPDSFSPSSSAVAVNILWFLSLSLSVAVSLIAILAKDWCSHFMSGRAGPFFWQGRLRQQRWDGINKWKMKEILNVLPLLMHIALLLFAVGLSVYLWDINVRVALPVVVTTSLAALFYVVTASLPLFFGYCPYTTALTRFIYPRWLAVIDCVQTKVCIGVIVALAAWISSRTTFLKRLAQKCIRLVGNRHPVKSDLEASADPPPNSTPFKFHEKIGEAYYVVEEWISYMRGVVSTDRSQLDEPTTPMDGLTSSMLIWMIANCEDPKAISMALQALAGASRSLPRRSLWECGAIQLVCQRVTTCVSSLRASAGSTQPLCDSLIEDLSLYSRSHGFLTAFVEGEGLEIPGPHSAKFHLTDDMKPITGIEDAADWAHILFSYHSDFILNSLWTGLVPRYDLSAYEFNNTPTQVDHGEWKTIEFRRNQCPKQWELVQDVLSGCVANLPVTALLKMVDGITKTYLHNSSQSPVLLLRLLHTTIATGDNINQDVVKAIAIGLSIAAISTGSFPMKGMQLVMTSSLDTDRLRRPQAIQAYDSISTRNLGVQETSTLLFFGLVCLLGDLSGICVLKAGDIGPIEKALYYIDKNSFVLENTTYKRLCLTLDNFGPSQHISQVLLDLIRAVSPRVGQGPNHGVECELQLRLRIEGLLSNSWMCNRYAGEIIAAWIWDPTHVDPTWLRRLRSQSIASMLPGIRRDDVRSNLLVFFKQVVEKVDSTTGSLVLPGMELAWCAGRELLSMWDESFMTDRDSAAIETLLPTLYNSSTVITTHDGYPANLEELGLANHWLPKIVDICRDDPASFLNRDLLEEMVEFYQDDEQKNTKPRTEVLPESIDPTWTWLEILQDLQDSCKPCVAIERLAKINSLPQPRVEMNPTTSGAHEDEQGAGSHSHPDDGSMQ